MFHFQETSVVIKVTLKKESGSEPVEKVNVEWKLLSPDGSKMLLNGTAMTSENGQIGPLHLKVPEAALKATGSILKDSSILPFSITFAKHTSFFNEETNETDVIPHTFLCEDETEICPEDGFVVYLSHLNFKSLVSDHDTSLF